MSHADDSTEQRLTEETFWDDYWSHLELPKLVDPDFSFDRCLSRAFLAHVPPGEGRRLIEVGCAPGRWMIFFQKMLGYTVAGIEYVATAAQKTEQNLALNGVPGEVYQTDFFAHDLPPHSYDAVLSLGFIEHFSPVEPVIGKHVRLLKPGGLLILGVPNFCGVNHWLQKRSDPEWLEVHNTRTSHRSFFAGLCRQFSMEPIWIGYTGGFEPALFKVADLPEEISGDGRLARTVRRRRRGLLLRVLTSLQKFRNRFALTDFPNNPLFSSYLIGVYRVTSNV